MSLLMDVQSKLNKKEATVGVEKKNVFEGLSDKECKVNEKKEDYLIHNNMITSTSSIITTPENNDTPDLWSEINE